MTLQDISGFEPLFLSSDERLSVILRSMLGALEVSELKQHKDPSTIFEVLAETNLLLIDIKIGIDKSKLIAQRTNFDREEPMPLVLIGDPEGLANFNEPIECVWHLPKPLGLHKLYKLLTEIKETLMQEEEGHQESLNNSLKSYSRLLTTHSDGLMPFASAAI